MLEIILALLLGSLAGIFTGLCPGIHINLVSSFLLFISASLLAFTSPLTLVVFIVSMSITHIFFDFIPSVYLGAPDDSGLATMPGHSLLLKGKGHEAVVYLLLGALFSIIPLIILTPIILFLIPKTYPFLERMMAWLLVIASCFIIGNEKNSKLLAAIVFLLSGFLGISALFIKINQPLLPLLSGLFGSSTLIFSLSQKTQIPKQETQIKIKWKKFIKPILANSLISPICALLPGMGGSQAAVLSAQICKPTRKQFLILLGSVGMIVMSLSFLALYSLDKARTGSAAAIQDLMKITSQELTIIYIIIIITSALAFFLALKISKIFAKKIIKISYSKISIAVLILLTLAVIIFSSLAGFIVYLASTTIGLLAIRLNIRKSNLMGCLLIPTILFYLPF